MRLAVEGRVDDAPAGGELVGREEPGAAVAHGQERRAADRGLEAKAEEPRVPLAEEAVDADVVLDPLADAGQLAVERHDGVEQPINGKAARLEVDAEEAGQEQVGLPGLDADAGRDAARVEIPAPGVDGVIRHDAAVRQRLRLAFDGKDSIDEQVRPVRESDAGREVIGRGEPIPQNVGDLPDGERLAHRGGERTRNIASRAFYVTPRGDASRCGGVRLQQARLERDEGTEVAIRTAGDAEERGVGHGDRGLGVEQRGDTAPSVGLERCGVSPPVLGHRERRGVSPPVPVPRPAG